jgi:hypothetical protein
VEQTTVAREGEGMLAGPVRSLALAGLSAVTAEFLLGDQYLSGLAGAPQQIAMILLFTAFYGGSAVVIRELTRRRGRGWPTIVTLALTFGLVEEGLVPQSLFDPAISASICWTTAS